MRRHLTDFTVQILHVSRLNRATGTGLRSRSEALLLVFPLWQMLRQQNQDGSEYCQDDIHQITTQEIVFLGNGEQ